MIDNVFRGQKFGIEKKETQKERILNNHIVCICSCRLTVKPVMSHIVQDFTELFTNRANIYLF